MPIRGARTKRAQGRGCSDPPQPSTSLGVKNDKNRIQKKGPVKGFDALNNKQKPTPFNSEQNDEDNGYNDGEDEEMQLIMEEIDEQQSREQQATDANNAKKCVESSFGLPNNVGISSGGPHVESDRQNLISLEGIYYSGRRITRGLGRGRSDPPGPSQSCINPPPQSLHTSVSPGVNNIIQKKRRSKGVDTLNDKQKSTAFNSEQNDEHCDKNDGEDEELQLIIEKICQPELHKQQATEGIPNSGRRITRGRGRGRGDAPGPSQLCIDTPANTWVSPGVEIDKNRIQKKGRGKGVDAFNNKQKSTTFNSEQNDAEDEELELITEKMIQPQLHKQQATNANNVEKYIESNFGLSHNARPSSVGYHVETDTRKVISVEGISNTGRGVKRGRGRGRSDAPGPSQSCIDPPAHTLVIPGVQNDNNRVQRKGLVNGFDALYNKQKATAFNSEHSNEYSDHSNEYSDHSDEYSDHSDGEDEEMQLLMQKIFQRQLLKQQAAIANNVKKYIASSFGLSDNVRPSSGRSCIEAGRRKVVSVEGMSNPGRRIKRGRGRDRSDPLEPSQPCIHPPLPPPEAHTSISPVRTKQKQFKNPLKSARQSQRATHPQAPAQVHTSPQASHVPSQVHTSPQAPTSAHSVPRTPHVGHSPTKAPTNSLPLVEGSSYATQNDTTPENSSSTHETPQQSQTSRQCVGRESTSYWTVEAIDPQGATKKIQLKYWQVNDLPIGERVIVHFDDQGAAYGEAQGLLAGYCGTLATNPNLFPINYERWAGKLGLPKTYLDNCFENNLKSQFQFRTTESLAKRYCKLSIAKKWASHRHSLWSRFYDPSKTRDQIISNTPLGVDPIQWAHYVNYRLKPETLELCRKNKENRSKQVIPHTGGSKPLSRKRHEMFLQTGEQPCRAKLYIETHKKKDGSFVNDAAKGIVEQIEVCLAQSSVHESEISPNDALGRVFGPEHSGRVRGMGMGAAPIITFKNNGARLPNLSNSLTAAAATSSSNFWEEKYTHLESKVQNTMEAFKAYIIMKEGRIPDQMAGIFDSSNPVGVASEPNLALNARESSSNL